MKESEARTLIAMMAAATAGGTQLELDKEAFWIEQLVRLDADQASEAVLSGIQRWEFFPSWKEFAQAHTDVGRARVREKEQAERTGEYEQLAKSNPKREVPFWVKRWVCATMLYARWGKDRDDRRFVEMDRYADITVEVMPDDAWVEEARTLTDAEVWRSVRPELKT